MGYATGIAPVVSYNYGAKRTDEIKGLFKKSMVLISSSAVLMVGAVMLSANVLASIFVSYDEGLMTLTSHAIRLYNWSFLLCGFNLFAAAFFAALNNGFVSSVLSLTRILVFQLAMIFVMPLLIGNDGIWLSMIAAEILSVIVAFGFVVKNRNKYQYY